MPWISLIVLVPLAGALLIGVLPQSDRAAARITGLVTAGATLVLSLIALGLFDRDLGGLQLVDHLDWVSSIGLAWDVGVDGISIWLVLLTTVLFALGVAYTAMRMPERGPAYMALLLLAECGLLGLFAAGDLVLFYVFWEAMLVPFAFLIWVWGGERRRRAGLTFVIYTMVGSLIMLVAILATAFIAQDITGQFTFNIGELRGVTFSETQSTLLFLGFALAFAIKLPLWPLHAWLPLAYAEAPITVTALLAAVMSKAGAYGFLRIGLPLFPEGANNLAILIAGLAVAGIVYGSLLAWRAPTMRLLVAYSSLAHLGFILLGIMIFDQIGAQGAVLQMVNHGIVVAAAFIIVGVIARGTGTEDIDRIGGLAARAPWLAGIFLVVAMASLAVPGSNAFVGEFFILTGVFRHEAWLAVLACIGIVYAAVYMLRLYQSSMNGPQAGLAEGRRAELRGPDVAVLVPLVAIMLFIALWPASIVGATERSVARAIAPAQVAAGRPAGEILGPVRQNPPRDNLPLPGDETTATGTQGTP